jgi:hypothetical protein
MIKQQKIILYLILINIFFGCTSENYIKNKYKITGIKVDRIDSFNLFVKFDVEYYSDSTQKNIFPSSIEKGLDGSNDKILSLKTTKGEISEISKLLENINSNKRGFRGEKIKKGYQINCEKKINEEDFFLIIQRKEKLDTLFNIN